jgi:hypothetical protein
MLGGKADGGRASLPYGIFAPAAPENARMDAAVQCRRARQTHVAARRRRMAGSPRPESAAV